MPFTPVVLPVAVYLLLYAPGHYLLRLASKPRNGSLLFREVLLSLCCSSWIGFVLAELGAYSLWALLGCLAGLTATAAFLSRDRAAAKYRAVDLAGLVVVGVSWLWLSPPLDTRILGSDSSGYLAAGVHLSRHGSLIIHDPTVPLLPPMLKVALFPSLTETPWAPPYFRLLGSLTLRTMNSDEVLPAFHHLITVWVAIFHGLGGSAAAQWAITLFGGLSMWAMVEFAAATCGGFAAVIFFALLSLSAIQGWYSRFLMPEIPAQFFLWGGLACVALWHASRERADAVLAGLAFGMAGLMRTENAVFAFLALLIGLASAEGKLRTQRFWLLACAGALWMHAAAHLFYFRTHYVGILGSLLPETVALFTDGPWWRLMPLVISIGAFVAWHYRRGSSAPPNMLPFAGLTAVICLWGEWQHGWSGFGLLAAYIGIPTVVAGTVGFALFARDTRRQDIPRTVFCVLAALAAAQFLLAPHATPVPIWVVRRAATMVLPAFCLGVAVLGVVVARRLHWLATALIVGLALAGQARPFTQLRWTPYYEGGLSHVRAIAEMLPPGACLLYDAPLTAWGFAQALWAERDMPAYLLTRFNPLLVLQVVRAVDGMPVYWVTESRWPPPLVIGYSATRVGTYSFTLLTPTLDEKTEPGMSNLWNRTIALYEFRRLESAPSK